MNADSCFRLRIPAVVTAVYACALVLGTHWPQSNRNGGFEFADKFLHLGAYAGLAILCRLTWLTLPRLAIQKRNASFFFWLLLAAGAVDELTQIPVPGREGSLADWFADGLGIALGLLVAQLLTQRIIQWRVSGSLGKAFG